MVRPGDRPTWLSSDRLIARTIARPVARFLAVEASGGIVLLAATVAALVWANSPWRASYHDVWHTEVALSIGNHVIREDLQHWVNDGLMALFFFVVGLEIKQELVDGQLAHRRDATLPVIAAAGGMLVPALLYATLNAGGDGSSGWGIPMATDIAFAVGVVALLGSRVPSSFKVVLLALAIVDDIGAIIVIAVFYSDGFSLGWAAAAAGGIAIVVALRYVQVPYVPVYAVVGLFVWWCTYESGIHATIAGVALGLLTPARPTAESVPVAERLQDLLHPWTGYVVIPVFALANAGIELSRDAMHDAVTSRVSLGIVLGLVVGKFIGITGAVTLATRLRVARLPEDFTRRHVVGLGLVGGVGFTVSLFIAALAFTDERLVAEAKIGIFAASIIAAVLAIVVLSTSARSRARP